MSKPSPLGAAFAAAGARKRGTAGYHGYHYKLLTSQGPHAPGGAYDYVAHGKLFGGFARHRLAGPLRRHAASRASWSAMTGRSTSATWAPNGATKAAAMKSFDPGPGWAKVSP